MYNSDKVIPGIIIFVLFVTLPIWWNHGKTVAAPQPELPQGRCVESRAYMRSHHMQILNDWRNKAIRDGMRVYTASDGARFWIGLQGGCMKCHQDKSKFCDRCHEFAAVKPYCWHCHIPPETKEFEEPRPSKLLKLFGIPEKLGESGKVEAEETYHHAEH